MPNFAENPKNYWFRFSRKSLCKSAIFIRFGWNLVYNIHVGVIKNVVREFFIFAFFAVLRGQKARKCQFLAKIKFFAFSVCRKTAKNAKMKNSRINFFLIPTRMLYTKMHPKIMKIEDLHTLLPKLRLKKGYIFYIKGFPFDLETPRYFDEP